MSENLDPNQPNPNPSPTDAPPAGDTPPAAAYYEAFKDEGLKTSPSVQRYKTVEDLAAGYVNLEKRLGGNPDGLIRLPEKLDDKEAMKAIWQKLGGPEKVDGYKVDLSKASEPDKAAATEFLAEMHKAGPFPPAMVETAVAWWQGKIAQQQEAQVAEATRLDEEGKAALKAEWGAAYDQRGKEIGKLIADLGGADLAKELDGSVFGSNPKLAIFLGKLVDKMAEPGGTGDGQRADTPQGGALTPAQAKARANELESHPAFRDSSHAQHKDVVKQRNDALRMAEAKA